MLECESLSCAGLGQIVCRSGPGPTWWLLGDQIKVLCCFGRGSIFTPTNYANVRVSGKFKSCSLFWNDRPSRKQLDHRPEDIARRDPGMLLRKVFKKTVVAKALLDSIVKELNKSATIRGDNNRAQMQINQRKITAASSTPSKTMKAYPSAS